MYGWRTVFARVLVAGGWRGGAGVGRRRAGTRASGHGEGIDLGSLYGGTSMAWSINSAGTIAVPATGCR